MEPRTSERSAGACQILNVTQFFTLKIIILFTIKPLYFFFASFNYL